MVKNLLRRKRRRLIVVDVQNDKALYPEVEVTVDASCCAGSTPENHLAALEVMKSCQINVIGEKYD